MWAKVLKFLREVRGEFDKVSWPKRGEIIVLTTLVVMMVFLLAIYIGGLDAIFRQLFRLILGG